MRKTLKRIAARILRDEILEAQQEFDRMEYRYVRSLESRRDVIQRKNLLSQSSELAVDHLADLVDTILHLPASWNPVKVTEDARALLASLARPAHSSLYDLSTPRDRMWGRIADKPSR